MHLLNLFEALLFSIPPGDCGVRSPQVYCPIRSAVRAPGHCVLRRGGWRYLFGSVSAASLALRTRRTSSPRQGCRGDWSRKDRDQCFFGCSGHRLCSQTRRRVPRRSRLQCGGRHPPCPLSRKPQPPEMLEPGRIYEMTIDLVGTSNVFLKPPRPGRPYEQSFPAVRPKPEHGRSVRKERQSQGGPSDYPPLKSSSIVYSAAIDSAVVATSK